MDSCPIDLLTNVQLIVDTHVFEWRDNEEESLVGPEMKRTSQKGMLGNVIYFLGTGVGGDVSEKTCGDQALNGAHEPQEAEVF